MVTMGTLIVILLSSSGLYLFFSLVKFLHKMWWTPMRIKHLMESQGIKGPPYRFIHGNIKEISNMRDKYMGTPMDLSDDVFPRILPHIYSWVKIYGTSFLQWLGPKAELVVTEPEFIKEILNNREKFYAKPDVEVYLRKLLGDGLVISEGEKWAKLRKIANHSFRVDSLKTMIPAMVESVEMMLERWKNYEGKEIEVGQEFWMLTSEVISRTAFGSNFKEGENIFQMLSKLLLIAGTNEHKIRLPIISNIFKTRDDIESDKLQKGIRDLILDIIQKREKTRTGEVDSYGTDFLGLLLKAYHDDQESYRLSLEDITDECKTFYAAGQGTTALALSWAVLLLAIHTDWQEKARQEVFKVFGHGHINSEGIARLKTMSMIINETLRLYPPGAALIRKVHKEARLGNLILPENININIPTLALHYDPKLWGKDAHLFNPERFSEGVSKATNNNTAMYLPFGLGPRVCVGMNYATNQVKIVLAMILQRYSFTLSPNYIHSPIQVLTIRPQHGIQVNFHAL